MATAYKTPGVYVEEISKFPPSIAAVETAIPAFIGYTEKAEDEKGSSLTNKPKRITSLLEYETYFGGAQPETGITVTLKEEQETQNGTPVRTALKATAALDSTAGNRSRHMMHYALQMFFDNGGGPCYIVSVAPFGALGSDIDHNLLEAGLDALEKEDEPTLIVFPEGQGISSASMTLAFSGQALASTISNTGLPTIPT